MKLPLRRDPLRAELQQDAVLGPLGLSLGFQKIPVMTDLLTWIDAQKDTDGWYRSFAAAPAGRAAVALVADQGWVLLALAAADRLDEAMTLAETVLAGSILPRDRGGDDFSNAAAAWFVLCADLALPAMPEVQASMRIVADQLLASRDPQGLVTTSPTSLACHLPDSMLACALWERLGTDVDREAALRVRLAFQTRDLYGQAWLGSDDISLESLVLAAFMSKQTGMLARAERELYDSFSGGARWEAPWRRTSHQAACYLALAEDDMRVTSGRASLLRHRAVSALGMGGTPPVDVLGLDHLERESQLAYAAMLYLGLRDYRGIESLWS